LAVELSVLVALRASSRFAAPAVGKLEQVVVGLPELSDACIQLAVVECNRVVVAALLGQQLERWLDAADGCAVAVVGQLG